MPFLAFLAAAAFVPWWPDGAQAPRWAALSIGVPIALMYLRRFHLTVSLVFIAAFMLYGALTLAWAPVLYDGLYIYWHFAVFAALFVYVSSADFDPWPTYLAFGCGAALHTLLMFVSCDTLSHCGLHMNKNLGAEAGVLAAVALALSYPMGGWLVAAGAAVPAFLAPMSRGALLGGGAAVLVAFWQRYRFVALLLGILLVGVAARIIVVPGRLDSLHERVTLWRAILEELDTGGKGLGALRVASPYFEYAHNDLLQTALEMGVVGAAAFVLFFASCFVAGAARERAVIAAFLVEGCFGFPFYMPATMFLAAVACGVAARAGPDLRDVRKLRQL